MNVVYESKNGMALRAIWQDISDLKNDRRRCLNGAVTYMIGRGGGVWGHDIPSLDAEIAAKTAEFERLKSTNLCAMGIKINTDQLKTAISQAINNFDGWDWTMEFSGRYFDSAPEEDDTGPGADEARQYAEDVNSAVAKCQRLGERAIEAIDAGNIKTASQLITEAADTERQFGDDPEWGRVRSIIEEMIEAD